MFEARPPVLLTAAPGDDVPFWALTWGPPPASVYSRTAKVHETQVDYQAATQQYILAAAFRPSDTYARIVALDLVSSAEMQVGGCKNNGVTVLSGG